MVMISVKTDTSLVTFFLVLSLLPFSVFTTSNFHLVRFVFVYKRLLLSADFYPYFSRQLSCVFFPMLGIQNVLLWLLYPLARCCCSLDGSISAYSHFYFSTSCAWLHCRVHGDAAHSTSISLLSFFSSQTSPITGLWLLLLLCRYSAAFIFQTLAGRFVYP